MRLVADLHRGGIEELTLGFSKVESHAGLKPDDEHVTALESTISLTGPRSASSLGFAPTFVKP